MEYEIYDKKEEVPLPVKDLAPRVSHEIAHYHGSCVRKLFFFAAVLMLVSLPFFRNDMAVPVIFSVLAILAVTFAAGYTNPKTKWILIFNTIVAAVGLVVFGMQAILGYSLQRDALFFVNLILALDFLFAFYYSVKTVRGHHLRCEE